MLRAFMIVVVVAWTGAAAEPAKWVDVTYESFRVQMPGKASPDRGEANYLQYKIGDISYILSVKPVPAELIAQGSADIIAQFSKTARTRPGVKTEEERAIQVDGHDGRMLHVVSEGVNVYLAYLPAGRWHAQLTAIYPPGAHDPAAASRFLASLHVAKIAPKTKSWTCDALLVTLCDACGSSSPACKFAITGESETACATEAALMTQETLRDRRCKEIARKKMLDLTGMTQRH